MSNSALPRKRSWRIGFFTAMPGVLLLFVVAGFTRTLFARPVFHPVPIPPYLYVHGIVLTSWYVWACIQSLLIGTGRVVSHRRFGSLAAWFAAVVFVAALMASLGSVSRNGFDLDADASVIGIGVTGITVAAFFSEVIWVNIFSALSFAGFLVGAVILRRRPQAHKRLMLLASISIIGPALARMARWPVFGGEQGPFVSVVLWSLVLAVVAYDLVSRKRLESSTAIGIVWLLIVPNAAVWVSRSDIGVKLIYALR